MRTDFRMRDGRDPHEVLGVPRGADRHQVVRAFHRKVRQGGHPDTGGDSQTFDELIRARDSLLSPARPREPEAVRRPAQATPAPRASRVTTRPEYGLARTAPVSRLAIAAAAVALLGPLLWPAAIVLGHLALRRIEKTGRGGGTFIPVLLFFLYILTVSVWVPLLTLVAFR